MFSLWPGETPIKNLQYNTLPLDQTEKQEEEMHLANFLSKLQQVPNTFEI